MTIHGKRDSAVADGAHRAGARTLEDGLDRGYLPDRTRPRWYVYGLTAFFCAFVLLPAIGAPWSDAPEIGWYENRKLAPRPALPASVRELRDFTAGLDRYVSDRLGLRTTLIRLDHAVAVLGFHRSPVSQVLLGKDGWLFFTGEDSHALDRNYRGIGAFTDADVERFRAELQRRHDFLAARGIAYVAAVVPDKYSVYPEFLPDWVRPVAPRSDLDRIEEAMRRSTVSFIDLRTALRERKAHERVYYKTDSHWNYLGATVGYREIMRAVARMRPGIPVADVRRPEYDPAADFYSGDLAQMLGLPHRLREDDVAPFGKILANPQWRCAKDASDPTAAGVESYAYRCANPPPYTALVLRDSMAIPLIPMLSENFGRVVYLSTHRLDRRLVEEMKPDLVLDVMVERAMGAIVALPPGGPSNE